MNNSTHLEVCTAIARYQKLSNWNHAFVERKAAFDALVFYLIRTMDIATTAQCVKSVLPELRAKCLDSIPLRKVYAQARVSIYEQFLNDVDKVTS